MLDLGRWSASVSDVDGESRDPLRKVAAEIELTLLAIVNNRQAEANLLAHHVVDSSADHVFKRRVLCRAALIYRLDQLDNRSWPWQAPAVGRKHSVDTLFHGNSDWMRQALGVRRAISGKWI